MFDYLAHLGKVVNDHADQLDNWDVSEELLRRRVDTQAMEIANVKAIFSKANEDMKHDLERNDAKLKEVMESSLKGVWDFLAQNNSGIQHLFSEADASFARLKKNVEEAQGGRGC